jgi:hypothetical protein
MGVWIPLWPLPGDQSLGARRATLRPGNPLSRMGQCQCGGVCCRNQCQKRPCTVSTAHLNSPLLRPHATTWVPDSFSSWRHLRAALCEYAHRRLLSWSQCLWPLVAVSTFPWERCWGWKMGSEYGTCLQPVDSTRGPITAYHGKVASLSSSQTSLCCFRLQRMHAKRIWCSYSQMNVSFYQEIRMIIQCFYYFPFTDRKLKVIWVECTLRTRSISDFRVFSDFGIDT